MAGFPTMERAIVDPNGDTLLIIKDPKWELLAWKTSSATQNDSTDTAGEASKPDEVHILVSSRQLRIVSAYFDNMFKGNYKETQPGSFNGKYHISADGWNPDALKLAMNIAHVQVNAIPDKIALTTLVELIVVTDYYDMERAVAVYTKPWVDQHLKEAFKVNSYGVESTLLLFLASKFNNADVVTQKARLAVQESAGPIQDLGLPFPKHIIDKLENRRINALNTLINGVSSLMKDLEELKPPCHKACSETCSALLFGTLRRGLRAAGYLGMVEAGDSSSVVPLYTFYKHVDSIKSTEPSCTRDGTFSQRRGMMYGYYGDEDPSQSQTGCSIQDLLSPLLKEALKTIQINRNEYL